MLSAASRVARALVTASLARGGSCASRAASTACRTSRDAEVVAAGGIPVVEGRMVAARIRERSPCPGMRPPARDRPRRAYRRSEVSALRRAAMRFRRSRSRVAASASRLALQHRGHRIPRGRGRVIHDPLRPGGLEADPMPTTSMTTDDSLRAHEYPPRLRLPPACGGRSRHRERRCARRRARRGARQAACSSPRLRCHAVACSSREAARERVRAAGSQPCPRAAPRADRRRPCRGWPWSRDSRRTG